MVKGKDPQELRENPRIQIGGKKLPELPVNAAIGQLTKLKGDELEITTRSNPTLAKAASVGYIYTHTFASSYVQGRIEQIERLAISAGGQGRRDLIDAVKAGGRIPDAYYGGERGSREFTGLREVDD